MHTGDVMAYRVGHQQGTIYSKNRKKSIERVYYALLRPAGALESIEKGVQDIEMVVKIVRFTLRAGSVATCTKHV